MSTRIGSETARASSASPVVPGSPLMSRLPDPDALLIPLRPARCGPGRPRPEPRGDRARHADLHAAAGPAPSAAYTAQPRALHPFGGLGSNSGRPRHTMQTPLVGVCRQRLRLFVTRPVGPGGAAGSRPAAVLPSSVGAGILDQADEAVLIPVTTVDDARMTARVVAEQVEVVPHQFHLQQRLVDAHRHGRVE